MPAIYITDEDILLCERHKTVEKESKTELIRNKMDDIDKSIKRVHENLISLRCSHKLTFIEDLSRTDSERQHLNKYKQIFQKYADLNAQYFTSSKDFVLEDFTKLEVELEEIKRLTNERIEALGRIMIMQNCRKMFELAQEKRKEGPSNVVTFQSKLCLKRENEEYQKNFQGLAVKEYKREMKHVKAQNKIVKEHAPECYKYHQQFFKECNKVVHKTMYSDITQEDLDK